MELPGEGGEGEARRGRRSTLQGEVTVYAKEMGWKRAIFRRLVDVTREGGRSRHRGLCMSRKLDFIL